MNKKGLGWSLLGLGAVLALLGLTADLVGLGDGIQFGPRQIAATVVGVLAAATGIIIGDIPTALGLHPMVSIVVGTAILFLFLWFFGKRAPDPVPDKT